jgi:hypothetical protein
MDIIFTIHRENTIEAQGPFVHRAHMENVGACYAPQTKFCKHHSTAGGCVTYTILFNFYYYFFGGGGGGED